MRAKDLGGRPYDVLAIPAAPPQRPPPKVLDEPGQGGRCPPEQSCGPVEVDGVAADDERLEDLQMPPVESVEGPLDTGTRAGAGRQRGQVVRSRAGQIGSTADQFLQLVVTSTPDVIGEAPEG